MSEACYNKKEKEYGEDSGGARGRDTDMGASYIFICQIKFLCYYIFFFPSQCDSPLSLDTTGHDNASPCDKIPEQREHAC